MTVPHILFADDDSDTREMVKKILQLAGFRVSLAANAAEVLSSLSTNRFDAFILDNWMPDKTGLELCEQIRQNDKTTPIFFCSGAASDADIEAGIKAGAQGYLTKPFEPDDLVQALRALVTPQY
jgi:DNA-binding response OmpR family regulator